MKKIFLFLAVIIAFTGCERNFEEINSNPNDPTEVPATNVLLSSITSGLNRVHGASMNMTYAGLWVQHYSKIQYIDEDNYNYRADAMDAHWTGLYAGPLFDLQDIINRSTDETPNMRAAAMVMKAYYMAVIADCWGSVPFSEALLGNEELTPAYDDQAAIYAGIDAMLSEASAAFDATADDLGAGDIIYNGDVSMWQKLANSLRVRYLMRTSGPNPGNVATAASILANEPVFTSNADNAGISFIGDAIYSNPLYENKYFDGRDDHAISLTLTDYMNANGISTVMDPRLPVYAEANSNNEYVGHPNGTTEPSDFGAVSRIGSAFRDTPTAPVWMMTYSELMFLGAEANQSKTMYLDAITASHDQHGVSTDNTYMTDADAAWDTDWMEALGIQKWIALYGNGVEAFAEWRRLDYPNNITEVPNSVYPGLGVPDRFPYASTEALTNGTNQSAAISSQAVHVSGLFGNVWWDQN
jgi:hypothetical protein